MLSEADQVAEQARRKLRPAVEAFRRYWAEAAFYEDQHRLEITNKNFFGGPDTKHVRNEVTKCSWCYDNRVIATDATDWDPQA